MYPPDFERRLSVAEIPYKKGVNCVSLVLYLLGHTEEELYSNPKDNEVLLYVNFLSHLNSVDNLPHNPSTVVGLWRSNIGYYEHLELISPVDSRQELIRRRSYNKRLSYSTISLFLSRYLQVDTTLYELHRLG